MKPSILALALAALLPLGAHAGTFNWHGELMDGDAPADGAYDLRVRNFAHPGAKAALGEPTELPGVIFREGSFSVSLDVPDDADGITWVEVAVRKAGSGDDYVVLGAPQPVSKANSTCPGAWALDGNSGAPAGSFLGFVDNQPLVLKANTTAVATFTPRGTASEYGDAPSVALGSSANEASEIGATVGGGGSTRNGTGSACPSCKNTASRRFSAISGGQSNTASGPWSVVAGGLFNCAGGENSWAGGWRAKIRPGSVSGEVVRDAVVSTCLAIPMAMKAASSGPTIWAVPSPQLAPTSS